jgi:hypothetical protein
MPFVWTKTGRFGVKNDLAHMFVILVSILAVVAGHARVERKL